MQYSLTASGFGTCYDSPSISGGGSHSEHLQKSARG